MSGRVLITGATGALGRSVVQRFLDAGDRVLAVGTNEAALGELTELAQADAVASAIHFLTTPAAAGINGAAVRVPGRTL